MQEGLRGTDGGYGNTFSSFMRTQIVVIIEKYKDEFDDTSLVAEFDAESNSVDVMENTIGQGEAGIEIRVLSNWPNNGEMTFSGWDWRKRYK